MAHGTKCWGRTWCDRLMRTRKLTSIPQGLLDLAVVQEGLLSAAQCTEQGVSSARRSRLVAQRRWQHVTHGIYDTDPSHPTARARPDALDHLRRRSAWIALLACGPTSVAVGSCALALLGVRGLPLHIDPEAALPGGRHAKVSPGVQVRCYESSRAAMCDAPRRSRAGPARPGPVSRSGSP